MLSVTQLDYNNYWRAFKGNYAKGIRILANILQTPSQANGLTSNLGGVSVLLGTPVGSEDVNSETLRTMLLKSAYVDNAVNTWLGGFYTFDDLGTLFADQTVRAEVFASPLLWRAVSMGSVAMAKYVTNIAGLNPADYTDMEAVTTSTEAMEAVVASSTAMEVVVSSSATMNAVAASQTAMSAVTASPTAMAAIATSSMATAKYAASAAGLNPADYDDMTELATSSTAMAAVAASPAARESIIKSPSALAILLNGKSEEMIDLASYSSWHQIHNKMCFISKVMVGGSTSRTFVLSNIYYQDSTSTQNYERTLAVDPSVETSLKLFSGAQGLSGYSKSASNYNIFLYYYKLF